jgi:hypothetical protein
MQEPQWRIRWLDRGRDPQVAPNPAYPEGIDLDISGGAAQTCTTPVPYPARRCGYYALRCQRCGWQGVITTAGRPDDPRSVTVACKPAP